MTNRKYALTFSELLHKHLVGEAGLLAGLTQRLLAAQTTAANGADCEKQANNGITHVIN